MHISVHDLGEDYNPLLQNYADQAINAKRNYAPCKGCFHCWTLHPGSCDYKDSLYEIARILGRADQITYITENYYGSYSPEVKGVLDRGLASSTPLSTYRGGQMHHTLRYGGLDKLSVLVYGQATDREKATWRGLIKRNALNNGARTYDLRFFSSKEALLLFLEGKGQSYIGGPRP